MRANKQRVLRNLELLVIDEVSMVRADLLDTIDAVLRHFKHRPTIPFGGVQLLVIGDLFQLSPVVREEEWRLLQPYYEGPYFFQARVFRELKPIYIEFEHVYRQTNVEFLSILNEVRNNALTPQSFAVLNGRVQKFSGSGVLISPKGSNDYSQAIFRHKSTKIPKIPKGRCNQICLSLLPSIFHKIGIILAHIKKKLYLCAEKVRRIDMSKYEIKFITSAVQAFARRFAITRQASFRYLQQHNALAFLVEFYDVLHLQSMDDTIDEMLIICRQNGGTLA